MNKNTTAVLLIILAIGIYFTYTRGKIAELKSIQAVNKEYQQANDNSAKLLDVRDNVLAAYNSISEVDRARLDKLVPNTVDNVRLIIDVKDDIAARHGLLLKNIKTASPEASEDGNKSGNAGNRGGFSGDGPAISPAGEAGGVTGENLVSRGGQQSKYGVVSLSFKVTSSYEKFVDFLKDLEASLRLMDISEFTVTANDDGTYDFSVEIKTYWLKQE